MLVRHHRRQEKLISITVEDENSNEHLAATAVNFEHGPAHAFNAVDESGAVPQPPDFVIGHPNQAPSSSGVYPLFQSLPTRTNARMRNSHFTTGLSGISLNDHESSKSTLQQRFRPNMEQDTPSSHNPNKTTMRSDKILSGKSHSESEKDKMGHIKKPCNAFMWFMKENRAKLLSQEAGQQKHLAFLHQQLGMSKKEQQKYYDMAAAEREEHKKKYPHWSAKQNYCIHKKNKTRKKFMENDEKRSVALVLVSIILTNGASIANARKGVSMCRKRELWYRLQRIPLHRYHICNYITMRIIITWRAPHLVESELIGFRRNGTVNWSNLNSDFAYCEAEGVFDV